ncbi:MAG: TIGR02757 family protein [Ignavibacteriaceae bacterium]|nr:TIGR02757 family protein [Ignavibacteriaceae bacterium]
MNLKQKLDHHYKAFDNSKLEPDPLQFPHLFEYEKDIELMAFIASVFAYGNVKQIINSLNTFLLISKNQPYEFISNISAIKNLPTNFVHRFYSTKDILHLFQLLNLAYNEYGSLKNLFLSGYNSEEENLKNAITNFNKYFLTKAQKEFKQLSRGMKFMFPLPEKGSACKRMNLFLRWMVRKDDLDFGLWSEIPTSKLIIPVDTHIARICRQLKLTKRKNVSWKMAEEITNNLKKFDRNDPIKYDFALCHIGMRKQEF